MTQDKHGPQLIDFENALSQATANLYIMYTQNGGNETARTVVQLLAQASKLSPYLEEVLEGLRDEAYDQLARPLEEAIEIARKEREKVNEQ